jgi:signal transduction histidine kinase
MHQFLLENRSELIIRCTAKVAQRPQRAATVKQLANGVPMFLDQMINTLAAEENNDLQGSIDISGALKGNEHALSEMGVSATAHGKQLLNLGYTVDLVVHDYGDLFQAITDLASEQDEPFSVSEFRNLNRCLDNAIAGAVTEFSFQRDALHLVQQIAGEKQRLGFLVHELRNSLGTATLAVRALELGDMTVGGPTGAILKRSLSTLGLLVGRALADVRSEASDQRQTFSVASFVEEAALASRLDMKSSGCTLAVGAVDSTLAISANRELLHAALANLLQNAFKFTHSCTVVALNAYALDDHVLIEVADHCGGLAPGGVERMFVPLKRNDDVRAGLGLGLSIARQSIEADLGALTVRDVPGVGCVFTISLPRHLLH